MNISNIFQSEYQKLKPEVDKKIKDVFSSGNLILGDEVLNFEKEYARYLGVRYVIGVGSGMDALTIGMMASGIEKGDEIITTPLSAVASTLAITSLGAVPVFVDTDQYFHIDADLIESKITKKTKAILPVHLYGQPVDMEKIFALARKYHLAVFEDACQGHGSEYKGKKIGTLGMFGAFSFYPTKNLGCYGDAGAIATNNRAVADMCRSLRNYGQKDRYVHTYCGVNSRLDEIQAGILRIKLRYLDKWNKKRQTLAARYSWLLVGVGDIQTPLVRSKSTHIYHQYVIRTNRRDALLFQLTKQGIPALIHYPVPIHKQPCYKQWNKLHFPSVEKSCKEIMSLPIHPFMEERVVEDIVRAIKNFYTKRAKTTTVRSSNEAHIINSPTIRRGATRRFKKPRA